MPVSSENVPRAHGVDEVAFGAHQEPAGHGSHAGSPPVAAKVPAGHSVAAAAPAALKDPLGTSAHTSPAAALAPSFVENVPAGHGLQSRALVA